MMKDKLMKEKAHLTRLGWGGGGWLLVLHPAAGAGSVGGDPAGHLLSMEAVLGYKGRFSFCCETYRDSQAEKAAWHPHQLLHTQLSSHTTELGLMLSCLATHQLLRRRYPAPHGWLVRYFLNAITETI